jgi:hypothetical protein
MTICNSCNVKYEIKDFYGKEYCYKCTYQSKLKLIKVTKKIRKCGICNEILPRNRWKYCCEKCALIGQNIKKAEFWKRNLRDVKLKNYYRNDICR